MGREFSIVPRKVPCLETPFRRIVTELPVPASLPILERLRRFEPVSMRGQPPVVWDHAEDVQVYDRYGNMWLDWSSGVLVSNAGHGAGEIREAIVDQVESGLLHNYCFPSEERAQLVECLARLAPEGLDKVFLLTTGSEAAENALKLARTWGIRTGGRRKIGFVGFERGFHGRTLGAQQIGGIPGQKHWIVNQDPAIIQAPFPDGFWTEDTSFDLFCKTVEEKGLKADEVCGVMLETYQGGGPDFAPVPYLQELARWCKSHHALLIFDEVQAGFGRTGKLWGFEHYEVIPDLICFGKGVSSSLPLAGVIGRAEIMDQYPAGSMTSTHTGNPVCVAAALASLKKIVQQDLVGNSRRMGEVLAAGLSRIQERHRTIIGRCASRGLVGGLQMVKPNSREPDPDLAFDVVERCFHKGLLFFAPVGAWGQTVKVSPPLTISREAVEEGLAVLEEAIAEAPISNQH